MGEYDWKAEARRAHEAADASHREANAMRPCPNCGKDLKLGQLRTSKRWTYSHVQDSDCVFNVLGSAIKFLTEKDAREAILIFHKQQNPVDQQNPT